MGREIISEINTNLPKKTAEFAITSLLSSGLFAVAFIGSYSVQSAKNYLNGDELKIKQIKELEQENEEKTKDYIKNDPKMKELIEKKEANISSLRRLEKSMHNLLFGNFTLNAKKENLKLSMLELINKLKIYRDSMKENKSKFYSILSYTNVDEISNKKINYLIENLESIVQKLDEIEEEVYKNKSIIDMNEIDEIVKFTIDLNNEDIVKKNSDLNSLSIKCKSDIREYNACMHSFRKNHCEIIKLKDIKLKIQDLEENRTNEIISELTTGHSSVSSYPVKLSTECEYVWLAKSA